MQQTVIDFKAAKRRRDEGMQRAVDHADRKVDGWQDIALAAFYQHAQTHVTFTTEQVRRSSPHVPEPPDKRAWGAVARRACKERYIQKVGIVQAQSPTVHCMYVTLYQSQVLDLTAPLDEAEWKKLGRDYIRAFRSTVKADGFLMGEVVAFATNLGIAHPRMQGWWIEAAEAEGLEERGGGRWYPKACCPECEASADA